MNSRDELEKLLKKDPQALARFKKAVSMPREEGLAELHRLEQEFGIELCVEDFAPEAMSEEQLKKVSGGGADIMMDVFGVFTGLYGLYPPSTGRGTENGTKRFNSR